jgi:S-formylglutathione hydrolase FrmB
MLMLLAPVLLAFQDRPSFELSFTDDLGLEAFCGRALVFLSKTVREPRTWSNWARLEPVIGADFAGIEPGQAMVLDGTVARSFPVPLDDLEGGRYFAQAVLDVRTDRPFPGRAAGNPCSAPVEIELRAARPARIELRCDRLIPEPPERNSRYTHVFQVRSERLSVFHGRGVLLRALVHLPEAWFAEPDRRFPLHVFLSGFGATLADFQSVDWPAPPLEDVPMVTVYPDPSCASGYCGFADSDNNGPWGEAFVRELVPAIEQEYRCFGQPGARFLVGHSSGGWSALWLMTRYPDQFGYAWASSPDPVDFRDFLGVDLSREGANLFSDEHGEPRPFCQLGNFWPIGFTREYSDRERILRSGILASFEALFGPRGSAGGPEPLWDRETGAIRPGVARAWSRYDIGRILRERWSELGPLLSGKLAITIGDRDNFLLQGSVALLERDMRALGADVTVEFVPGDHFSVLAYEHYQEQTRAIAAAFRRWQGASGR